MMSAEEFGLLVKDLEEGVLVSQERMKRAVQLIVDLDAQNTVLSGALTYALALSDELYLQYGGNIANIIGIKDMGKKRKIAEVGAQAAMQLRGAVQALIAGMIEEANNIATQGLTVDGLDEVTDDETAAAPIVGGDE